MPVRPLPRLVCLCALLAGPAFAQAPAAKPPAERVEAVADPQARAQQRLADVTLLLHLSPAQQAAYQAMETTLRPQGGGWRDGGGDGPSPEELEARRKARADAMQQFSATLTPEQRPLFEALMRLQRGGAGAGRRGWGGAPPG